MKLGVPQFIVLAILCIKMEVALVTDGQQRTIRRSFMATLISTMIQIGILYAGGFF